VECRFRNKPDCYDVVALLGRVLTGENNHWEAKREHQSSTEQRTNKGGGGFCGEEGGGGSGAFGEKPPSVNSLKRTQNFGVKQKEGTRCVGRPGGKGGDELSDRIGRTPPHKTGGEK